MVLNRFACLPALPALVLLAARTVPCPALEPSHVLGPEIPGAANSAGHLQVMTTLTNCDRAEQIRQQGGTPLPNPPSAAQCAEADRRSRSEQEYQLVQPQ
jgi:hypothetical protein